MQRSFGTGLVILAALLVAGATSAGEYRTHKSARAEVSDAPVKDCTRFNGRWGYYGNPWCTPAEQARWDRWGAGKRWVR
jgi:hypothetical protein